MAATLLPAGKQHYTNADGTPMVGGQIWTYEAGTTTPKATFMDAAGLIPNTNPVVLDARGEAMVFWSGAYKVVLKDAQDATIWTADNVQSSDTPANSLKSQLASTDGPGLVSGTDLTKNYATGTLGWIDQQCAISLVKFPFSCVPDGQLHAATEAAAGTDNAAAVQWAIKWAEDKRKAVYVPGVFRVHNAELTIRRPVTIFSDFDAGDGYGGRPTLVYKPRAGFIFTGSGRSVTRTRVLYRGSAADPVDAPLSVGVNIQSEFVTLRKICLYLWFKRPADGFDPAVEKTNYGSNYDVAAFVGTRVRTVFEDVDIIGYWRQACLWEDVTRASNLPQWSDADGVKFDAGTVAHGSDGTVLKNCFFYGGKWAIKRAGALPKPGLPWYGAQLTMSATITVASQPAAGETVTLNGQVFTFATGSADGSTEILIGPDVSSTAANIAETAETYTINAIAAGTVPLTRCASYFSDGAAVRLFQREGVPTVTNAGGSNPFTLAATAAGLTLSGAAMATIADPAPYYDALAAAEAAAAGLVYAPGPDMRGRFGASDLRIWGGWLYGPDHHSGYRVADATGNYLTDAATCGGVIYISGMAGNASRKIQGMQLYGVRIASFEAYRVFADYCNRLILEGCHIEYHDIGAKTTSGASVKFDDTDTYGPIALTTNAQNTVCTGLSSNIREAFIPSTVRFTNIAPAGSRQITRFTDVVRTGAYFETAFGLRSTLGDLDYRTLSASHLHRWRGGNTTWLTLSSSGMTFGSTATATITAGAGEMDVRAAAGSGVRQRSGSSTVALCDQTNASFYVTGAIRHATDNVGSFGDATHRATQVYAANNAINTSQWKFKRVRGGLEAAEIRAWSRVEPQVFQWLASVERKGLEGARLNAGYIADWVAEAFRAEGLNPARYALWCEDPETVIVKETRRVTRERTETVTELEERIEVVDGRAVRRLVPVEVTRVVAAVLPVFDEDGAPVIDEDSGLQVMHWEPVLEEVDEEVEIEVQTGETRLGLRYEQCLVFEAAYQRAMRAADRAEIQQLRIENEETKRRVAALEGGA